MTMNPDRPILKIVHTISHREWSGMERRVFNESLWMQKQGHQVWIACPPGTPIHENAIRAGLATWSIGFRKHAVAADFLRLRRLLSAFRPHVLNTHGNLDAKVALTAALGLALPCAILSRHVSPRVTPSAHNRLLYRRMCHLVFTTSEMVSCQIRRDFRLPEDRVITVTSGIVPPDRLPEPDEAHRMIRATIGAPDGARFIGYAGRISPDKGLTDLVDAFAIVQSHVPDHHLILAGAGRFASELTARIRAAGVEPRVHLVGYQPEPWAYYRGFDVTILASQANEGVPQSLLEAMYARCPVIGAAVGGIPEVVENGVTGLLVPPAVPQALASAIMDVLTHPRAAQVRVESAFMRVVKGHTLPVMGRRILGIYNRLIRYASGPASQADHDGD